MNSASYLDLLFIRLWESVRLHWQRCVYRDCGKISVSAEYHFWRWRGVSKDVQTRINKARRAFNYGVKSKMHIFWFCVVFVLHGYETWLITEAIKSALHTIFVNRCLQIILAKFSVCNDNLWARGKQRDINMKIRRLKFGWIGHTLLKKNPREVCNRAFVYNSKDIGEELFQRRHEDVQLWTKLTRILWDFRTRIFGSLCLSNVLKCLNLFKSIIRWKQCKNLSLLSFRQLELWLWPALFQFDQSAAK